MNQEAQMVVRQIVTLTNSSWLSCSEYIGEMFTVKAQYGAYQDFLSIIIKMH